MCPTASPVVLPPMVAAISADKHHRRQRHVPPTDPCAEGDQVRDGVPVLARHRPARSAATAHHLIRDPQHLISVVERAHTFVVARWGTSTPPPAPMTGSAVNAATRSAPARRIACSRSSRHADAHDEGSSPIGQRERVGAATSGHACNRSCARDRRGRALPALPRGVRPDRYGSGSGARRRPSPPGRRWPGRAARCRDPGLPPPRRSWRPGSDGPDRRRATRPRRRTRPSAVHRVVGP